MVHVFSRRWRARAGTLVLVTAATTLGAGPRRWLGADQETLPTPAGQAPIQINVPSTNAVNHIALSPDGTQVVSIVASGAGVALWRRTIQTAEAGVIPGSESPRGSGMGFPFWSPDGRSVAYFSQGQLKVLEVTGGVPRTICEAPLGAGGSWNRDGVILFAPTPNGPLVRVPIMAGKATPVPVTTLDSARGEISHRHPWFLPDGHHFLFLALSTVPANSAIWVGSIDSAERTLVVPGSLRPAFAPPNELLYVTQDTLWARPFDLTRFAFTGEAVLIAEHVGTNEGNSAAAFSPSTTGSLAYRAAIPPQSVTASPLIVRTDWMPHPEGGGAPPAAAPANIQLSASVTVRLVAGKATYHLGEEIPLELEYRGTGDKDYFFSTEMCPLVGRLSSEKFGVTPADGTDDPLADFLASSGGFGGSCGSSWHPLDGTPLVIPATLNDWIRFTRPGSYRVVLTSTRLGRRSGQPAPPVISAPFDLTIVPSDSAWAAAETIRATDLIDRGVPSDVKHGSAILRYLGTEGAAKALVARYGAIATANGDIVAGLCASPHRALIVKQMEALVDAGTDLDAYFIPALTQLRVLIEMPPVAGDYRARSARANVVQAEYDAKWLAALARRPATAATLGAELARLKAENLHGPDASSNLQQHIGHDLEQHPAEAAAGFIASPPETQSWLLQSTSAWALLDRPWILPALRQVYAGAHCTGIGACSSAGDLALTRLYELAPGEGRPLILDEIRTGAHGIGYDALAILPDAALPEVDDVLQSRYASPQAPNRATQDRDRSTAVWLMARYGSPTVLPFVMSQLARRPNCVIEGALLAYLFKHDPPVAMAHLDPNLDLAARGACVIPLSSVAAHYWDDGVESAAIAELNDAAIRRVEDAADVLGLHGSPTAKRALVDRLGKWSAEWQGRAAELNPHLPYDSPQMLWSAIVQALLRNAQFALTKNDVANIRALCLADDCRTTVDGLAREIK